MQYVAPNNGENEEGKETEMKQVEVSETKENQDNQTQSQNIVEDQKVGQTTTNKYSMTQQYKQMILQGPNVDQDITNGQKKPIF